MTEKYIVRVQLIRSDNEGEYITGSFDYEVSPTTETYQLPLFMRAEKFYKQIQRVLTAGGKAAKSGKVTVTKTETLAREVTY